MELKQICKDVFIALREIMTLRTLLKYLKKDMTLCEDPVHSTMSEWNKLAKFFKGVSFYLV
jgi:hypothetical protein